jgi:hypothetical protein
MAKNQCEIKTQTILKQGKKISLSSGKVRFYSISHWKAALFVLVVFISAIILSTFVFTIFFPIFLIICITGCVGFLWILRELRKSFQDKSLEAEYIVDSDKTIQENDTD